MKVTCVEKAKFAPGKWKEASELMKGFRGIWEKKGFPPVKIHGCVIGGEVVQTLYFTTEWDSLSALESLMEQMFADPEMRALIEKWSEVVDSHELEILREFSDEELGL